MSNFEFLNTKKYSRIFTLLVQAEETCANETYFSTLASSRAAMEAILKYMLSAKKCKDTGLSYFKMLQLCEIEQGLCNECMKKIVEPANMVLHDGDEKDRKHALNALKALYKLSVLLFRRFGSDNRDVVPPVRDFDERKMSGVLAKTGVMQMMQSLSESVENLKEWKESVAANDSVKDKLQLPKKTSGKNVTESNDDLKPVNIAASLIRDILRDAKERGVPYVDIVCSEIHRLLGWDARESKRHPVVCSAMYKLKEYKTQVLEAPPSGKSPRLRIRYFL